MAEHSARPSVDEPVDSARERDEVRTLGGPELPQELADDDANGWFVGPPDAPERYELLGSGLTGGEGVTWRARYHGGLSSPLPLAVKVLHRPSGVGPQWPTAEDRSRWHDQTTLLRHLRPDHVVRVNEISAGPGPHRLGERPDGRDSVFIEMEWVPGPTLADLVRGHPAEAANLPERVGWLADACEGLAHLHSHTRTAGNPTVHRDVTPSNCIINPERGLVLIDVSTLQLPADGVDLAGRHTPAYSAPEVLSDPHRQRGPAADVYAIGALTFFCLLGEDPPPIQDARTSIRRRLQRVTRELGLKPQLLEHVMATLDPDPDRRPADLLTWARQLRALAVPRRRVLVGRAVRRPRVVVAALVVAALGGWLALDRPGGDPAVTPRVVPSTARTTSVSSVPASASGVITSPAPQTEVKDCAFFSGTARLPAGVTLILAKQNLQNGDERKYVQTVFGFEHPRKSWNWRGAQFFNDGSVGQAQRVELIAVPLRSAIRADVSADVEVMDTMARAGRVLAAVDVVRAPGPDGRTNCHPPS